MIIKKWPISNGWNSVKSKLLAVRIQEIGISKHTRRVHLTLAYSQVLVKAFGYETTIDTMTAESTYMIIFIISYSNAVNCYNICKDMYNYIGSYIQVSYSSVHLDMGPGKTGSHNFGVCRKMCTRTLIPTRVTGHRGGC